MFRKRLINCIIILILIVVAFLVQSSVFLSDNIPSPNLLLMLTSIFGFMGGKKYGMYIGFIGGLIIDIFFGSVLGFNAAILIFVGYFNGMFNKLFFDDRFLLPVCLVAGSDFAYNFIYYVFRFLLRNKPDFIYYLLHVIIPEILMTVMTALIFYKLIYLLYDRVLSEKKGSELDFD